MGATLSESIVEHIITNLFFRTVFFSGHNIKQHYRKQIFLDRLVLLCLKNMSETSVFANFFKKHYRKPTILYCVVWLCSHSMWETNVFAQFCFLVMSIKLYRKPTRWWTNFFLHISFWTKQLQWIIVWVKHSFSETNFQ